MSRTTTVLVLIQTLLVVVGFFSLGAVLKVTGYPDAPDVRWNPLAVFLREHGGWLLLLPLLWVPFATYAQHCERGFISSRVATFIGLGIALITIALFLYADIFPYTRPLLIHVVL